MTAAPGTWTGSPTFTYQWLRCDLAGANCVNLPVQATTTYVLTIADRVNSIRVVVTATNGAGSSSATSADVGFTGPPVEPDAAVDHRHDPDRLDADGATGSWLGVPVPTFTYQWERCSALGVACVDIALANASTYVPVVPDLGLTLRVKVSASNTGGLAAPVESAATAVITSPPSGGGGGVAAAVAAAATTSSSRATVDRTSAPVGGSYVWQINVTNAGGRHRLRRQRGCRRMSANLVFGFSQVNRGTGCSPPATAGTTRATSTSSGRSGVAPRSRSDHARDERHGAPVRSR